MEKQNDIRSIVQDANLYAVGRVGPGKIIFLLDEIQEKPVQIHVRTDGKIGRTADLLKLATSIKSTSVKTLVLSKADFDAGFAIITVVCLRFNYNAALISGQIGTALTNFVDELVDKTYLDPH